MSQITRHVFLRNTIRPYFLWFLSVLCLLYQFLLQFSSGVMTTQLMDAFHLTAARAGFLAGSYYYVYVLLQTPAGFLTDRFGPKSLLAFGCFLCSFGCFLFASAHTFLYAEIGRLLMGGSLSFAFVGMVYITATMLPSNIFSLMIGLAEMLAISGVVISEIYLAHTLNVVGWRSFIFYCGFVAILLGILSWMFFPSHRSTVSDIAQDVLSYKQVFKQFIGILKNPVAWANGIYAGLMFAVLTTFHGLWAQPFLITAYHMGAEQATGFSAMLLLGAGIGFPFFGWLGAHIKQTRYLMSSSALLVAVLLTFILSITNMPLLLLSISLFMTGFFCTTYVLCYSICHNIVAAGAKSTSIGFTNTLAVMTAPLTQPFVGELLEWITDTPVDDYTVLDYQLALGFIVVGLLVATILGLFLPSTRRKLSE